MNEIRKFSNSFEETLKDSDLQNFTADLAETFSDSLLNEGVLKDIPIIGSIVGLTKTAINLNDRLLVKKILHFISEIKEIEPGKRESLISSIDRSEKFKIRVGEKLLYILDKCDDHISAKYVAKLFTAFLNEELDYSDFLRASAIIQKIFIADLEEFILSKAEEIEKTITIYDSGMTDFQNSLISAGLCAMSTDAVSVRDQDDWDGSEKYVVEGGGMSIYLTEIGWVIKKTFKYCC